MSLSLRGGASGDSGAGRAGSHSERPYVARYATATDCCLREAQGGETHSEREAVWETQCERHLARDTVRDTVGETVGATQWETQWRRHSEGGLSEGHTSPL